MLKNRDTRVQIVIVEKGKYILLQHLAKKENKTFWGLPGGGREPGETDEKAAIREAWEETGLCIRLLPVKHEILLSGKKFVYDRIVTFLAYPVSGKAGVGYEPEARLFAAYNYALIGLRWQHFYRDEGLTPFTEKSIHPIRNLLESAPIQHRVGLIVHHRDNGAMKFLCISSRRHPGCLEMPHIDVAESNPSKAAVISLAEQHLGISLESPVDRGFFFHENDGRYYRTDVFSISLESVPAKLRRNSCHWLDRRQAAREGRFREDRRLILESIEELMSS
ncbi:MAG: NUDIX domain-containing protein [Desulfobacterales bacterium]